MGLSLDARSLRSRNRVSAATKPLKGERYVVSAVKIAMVWGMRKEEANLPHGVGYQDDADLSIISGPRLLHMGFSEVHDSFSEPVTKLR